MVDGRIRRGSIATAVGAAILVGLIGAGGGCSLVIGSAIPAFECLGTTGAECPGDQVCDPTQHKCVEPCSVTGCAGGFTCDPGSNTCVPVADAGDDGPTVVEAEASTPDTGPPVDATSRDAEAGPVETGPPVEAGCTGLGCPCSSNSVCGTGNFCADTSIVPSGLYTAAGSSNFCTKACCTSADCDANTVCYATGGNDATGGNFCVKPSWLQRSSFGTSSGGASCASGETCRSGLCADSACADTCCSTNEAGPNGCASGVSCRFDNFPGLASFDQNYVAWCGQGGSGKNEASCQHDSDCESELCGGGLGGCANACRNTADCGDSQESCAYVTPASPSTAVIAACFTGAGTGADGSHCTNDNECASQFCNTAVSECTDVCFANSDCPAGGTCVPTSFTLQSGGKVTVMACSN